MAFNKLTPEEMDELAAQMEREHFHNQPETAEEVIEFIRKWYPQCGYRRICRMLLGLQHYTDHL